MNWPSGDNLPMSSSTVSLGDPDLETARIFVGGGYSFGIGVPPRSDFSAWGVNQDGDTILKRLSVGFAVTALKRDTNEYFARNAFLFGETLEGVQFISQDGIHFEPDPSQFSNQGYTSFSYFEPGIPFEQCPPYGSGEGSLNVLSGSLDFQPADPNDPTHGTAKLKVSLSGPFSGSSYAFRFPTMGACTPGGFNGTASASMDMEMVVNYD